MNGNHLVLPEAPAARSALSRQAVWLREGVGRRRKSKNLMVRFRLRFFIEQPTSRREFLAEGTGRGFSDMFTTI